MRHLLAAATLAVSVSPAVAGVMERRVTRSIAAKRMGSFSQPPTQANAAIAALVAAAMLGSLRP